MCLIQRDANFDKEEMHDRCLEVGVQTGTGVGMGVYSQIIKGLSPYDGS